MKQSVIDQMKEYKHRNNVKAIKYEEGMELSLIHISEPTRP